MAGDIRVLVVDDSASVRAALIKGLSADPGIDVIGASMPQCGAGALQWFRRYTGAVEEHDAADAAHSTPYGVPALGDPSGGTAPRLVSSSITHSSSGLRR